MLHVALVVAAPFVAPAQAPTPPAVSQERGPITERPVVTPADGRDGRPQPSYIDGQVLVRFSAGLSEDLRASILGERFAIERPIVRGLDLFLVQILDGTSVVDATADLEQRLGIQYATPDHVVTNRDTVPSAVLIRALELDLLPPWIDEKQRQKPQRVAAGPGKLCRALQIDRTLNGSRFDVGQPLWLEPRSTAFQQAIADGATKLVQTTRIGLSQGVELPWRWYVADCPAVSKKG